MDLRAVGTRRVAVAWLGVSAVALGAMGRFGVSAQSTPTSETNLEPAEYVATIQALQTQVAQLEDRVSALSENRSATSAQGTETPSSNPTTTTYEVGEQVDVDVWSFVVTSVELAPTVDLPDGQFVARGIFVVVYLTITNIGNEPASFPYDDLFVKDSAGRLYGWHSDSSSRFQSRIYDVTTYEDLQPGFAYDSVNVFDVPATATGLSLETEEPSPFSVSLGV